MKGIVFLCMLNTLILRINTKVKECIWKGIYFSIVHISSNNVLGSLKLCMHVGNINVEGTVSQIFFHFLVFISCQKTGNFFFIN